MKDKFLTFFFILYFLFLIICIIAGIIILLKAIKKTYIVIRCKLSPSYKKRYIDQQIHKNIKQNLEVYYSKDKKSRYRRYRDNCIIYMQDVWNQYEDWRNPGD